MTSRVLKKAVARVASAAGPDARSRDAGNAGTLSRSGDAAADPAPPRPAGRSAGRGVFQHPARNGRWGRCARVALALGLGALAAAVPAAAHSKPAAPAAA